MTEADKRSSRMRPATVLHDRANLVFLPLLGLLNVLGLLGMADPYRVTQSMLGYIGADFCWVLLQPGAVPSLPGLILSHHLVTAALLTAPLRHPHLALFTCWDGLIEWNTFFLIARRSARGRLSSLFSALYWISFWPSRLVLFPALLPLFWRAMQPHPLWEQLLVCGCQIILIAFNCFFLFLTLRNRR